MKPRNKEYIWLLPLFIILLKWIFIFYFYRDIDFDLRIFVNFNDSSYFPFIVSLSELNLSPAFSEYFKPTNLIAFPIASIIFHAFFYKIFGLISYVFLEIIFVITAYFLIYLLAKKTGVKDKTALLGTLLFFSFLNKPVSFF